MTMHTAFGKASAIGQTPDALLAILTNRVENDNALGPQSHGVGPYSEGWLTSRKSALQSTRSTATCPALRGCPPFGKARGHAEGITRLNNKADAERPKVLVVYDSPTKKRMKG